MTHTFRRIALEATCASVGLVLMVFADETLMAFTGGVYG